jgi:hypothetical protein
MKKILYGSRLFLLACLLVVVPATLFADVYVTVGYAPPPLPVYAQPPCPAEGYIWTPGYWAYGPEGYFWVPGTWVQVPVQGYLWTPGYWGWGDGGYLWHPGYWGPQIGYYGGIDYGYGYPGRGYYGGYWRDRQFYYNRSVNNVVNVRNVYTREVVNNVNVTRVSYNGGQGGVGVRPTAEEQAAVRERHVAATNVQVQHEQTARQDRALLATVNRGRPAIAATPKPAEFHGGGVVAARNAEVNTAPPAHGNEARPNEGAVARPPASNAPVPKPPERDNTYHGNAAGRPANPQSPEQQNTYHGNADQRPASPPAARSAPAAEGPREVPRPPEHANATPEYRGQPSQERGQPAANEPSRPPAHANQAEPASRMNEPHGQQPAARPPEQHAAPPQASEHGAPPRAEAHSGSSHEAAHPPDGRPQ